MLMLIDLFVPILLLTVNLSLTLILFSCKRKICKKAQNKCLTSCFILDFFFLIGIETRGEFQMLFCALVIGHFGKGTPFVGTFQTKGPSRSPLVKGTCDGHLTEDHVIYS